MATVTDLSGNNLQFPLDTHIDSGELVTARDGTVAAPGLTFSDDKDTGLFRSATNTIGVAVGGVLAALFKTAASAVNRLAIVGSAAGSPVPLGPEGSDTNITLQLSGKGNGAIAAQLVGGEITFGAGLATVASAGVPVKVVATTAQKGDAVGLTMGTDNTITSLLTASQLVRIVGRFDVDVASGTDNVTLHIFVGGSSAFESAAQSITAATPVQFEIDVLLLVAAGEAIELYAENEDTTENVSVAVASEALDVVPAHGFLKVLAA